LKFWIGVTDKRWYEFLSNHSPDEVNFWQPSGRYAFRAIEPGEPFLFKLHYPLNYIVGGGFFLRHSTLPLSLAWEAFGQKNGTEDFETFREMILSHLQTQARNVPDPLIGCIILTEPFFFERNIWIPVPSDWSPNIVQGKTYDTVTSIGATTWTQVQERLTKNKELIIKGADKVAEEEVHYGAEYLAKARLGQGAFRVLVTDFYNRKCAITAERTLPVLEAAHIKPFAKSGPHRIDNGLLLRADLHKLFDLGYLTITNDYRVEVSKRIKEEYHNGREYYAMHGKVLNLPAQALYKPSREFIDWHNQNIYLS